jgi:hypothetical protein
VSMQMPSGPRPSAQTRRLDKLPSAAMSNAVSRLAKDSEMISVELSGVTAPVGEPQPVLVPAGRLDVGKPAQQNLRLGPG